MPDTKDEPMDPRPKLKAYEVTLDGGKIITVNAEKVRDGRALTFAANGEVVAQFAPGTWQRWILTSPPQ